MLLNVEQWLTFVFACSNVQKYNSYHLRGVLQGPLPCSGFNLYLHFAGGKSSAGPLLYKP